MRPSASVGVKDFKNFIRNLIIFSRYYFDLTENIFESLSVAGSMIGLQMCIAYANIIDPTTRQQVPIVSQFLMLLAILFLFATDGHLFLIETMVMHFEIIPLGLNQLSDQTGQSIISGGSVMFLKGL